MTETFSIQVTLPGGETRICGRDITVSDLLPARTAENGLPYLGALVNNDLCSLSFPLLVNSEVEFLTFADTHGEYVYRRSLAFVLAKAVRDIFPNCEFSVEHSIGNAYYCTFTPCHRNGITDQDLETLDMHMRGLIRRDIPLVRRNIGFVEAYRMLEAAGQSDKLNLLRYRNPPRIVMYCCQDFSDICQDVLAPSTGVLTEFRLLACDNGLILQFPEWKDGKLQITPYHHQPHLQRVFEEHKKWGRTIDIRSVADLNQAVAEQRIWSIIHLCEVQQEKKLAEIADRIAKGETHPRFILVAGPSSSGKTTFSKRLEVHLRVNGIRCIRLEVDNYFLDRDQTPRKGNGEFDFEHIEAIDLELLNKQLLDLEAGKEISAPRFNFKEGRKEYPGNKLRLEPDELVLLEGIHCLNPRLTHHVPDASKFKIYISALTQLKLDDNNRISTTDLRLLRRMVRDYRTRGNSALRTLQMWPDVRAGERKWIFPFQQQADVAFNSALDFEPAVLKTYVRPLLSEVKPFDREYADARRLLAFLEMVNSTSSEHVPPASLIREFIGGSAFEKDHPLSAS